MSSSSAAPSPRRYWCHECNASVQSVEGLEDPMCSQCHGSFLEEVRSFALGPPLPLAAFPIASWPSWSPSSGNSPASIHPAVMTELHVSPGCIFVYPNVLPQSFSHQRIQQLPENQQAPQDLVEELPSFPPFLAHLFSSLGGGTPLRSPTSPASPFPAGSAGSNQSASTNASAPGRQQHTHSVGPDILLARLMHMALNPPQQPQQPGSGPSPSQPQQGQRTTTPLTGGFQGGFHAFFTYPPASSASAGSPRSESTQTGASTPPLPPFLATLLSGLGLPINAQGGFNFGDFVFSQEHLDRIMEQLGQQGPQPQHEGMPAEFFTKGLPDVEIIEAQVAKGLECVICQDKYSVGETGVCKVGSCDHMFHRECVEPWLKKNHTCPTCRWDVLAEWKAAKEGRDRVPWADAAPTSSSSSSRSRSGEEVSAHVQEQVAGGGEEEKTPGSWEPEIEPLD